MHRRTNQRSSFRWGSAREQREADLFFADLVGRSGSARMSRPVGEYWGEHDSPESEQPPTVTTGRDKDEIIVTRSNGDRYRIRRKVRAQQITRPGRPRWDACWTDERVFLRVAWCEGTQGTIDVGANVPAALKTLLDNVVGQINRGAKPDEIRQTFENASVRPFVELDIAKLGSWKITGNLELDVNRRGIVSTTAKLTADLGWVSIGVQHSQSRNNQQTMATVTIPLGRRVVSGKRCPLRELAVWWDAECLKEVPYKATLEPLTIEKHETLYLYFEYATDKLRRDHKSSKEPADVVDRILRSTPKTGTALLNKRQLQRLDYLVRQGYWVTAVKGYTSPEGRRGPPRKGSTSKWEGNDALSEARALKVLKLIRDRYVPSPRLPMSLAMRFPPRRSLPTAVGLSEHPKLDVEPGVELEGPELDRRMLEGGKEGEKAFLVEHPGERARMTDFDRRYVDDTRVSRRGRAERLFENLRRVEIRLTHIERVPVEIPDIALVHVHDCPADVIEAAERKWGSRIPFTKPDPPVCP